MLELCGVSKAYKVANTRIEALKNVSLSFDRAEFVCVLGPSGCGKTTLLNVIGGLDRYDSGDLVISGVSTKKYKDRDWDTYRNHSIGFVFQSYNLIPHQTVYSNVELALTLAGISKKERRALVSEALAKVGLSDQANKKPNQMSGGQMQRVAIARALVNDPEILLADEPTGALDSVTSVQIMELLKDISKDRLIIMVTHNPELATRYSTRIVRLKDGEVVSDSKSECPVPSSAACDETNVASYNERFGESGFDDGDDENSDSDPRTGNAPVYDREDQSKLFALDLPDPAPSDPGVPALGLSQELLSASRRFSEIKEMIGSDRNESNAHDPETASSFTGSDDNTDTLNDPAQAVTAEEPDAGVFDETPFSTDPGENVSEAGPARRSTHRKGRKKKTSMSFFTALSLSFNNLLTKKGRTFMTAFAGSIGIIGIALILAMSTGIKRFIDDVQKETLSSYPITIVSEHVDLSAVLATMSGNLEEKTDREPGIVYSDAAAYDTFNALFSQDRKQNNLKAFKSWVDESMSDGSSNGLGDIVSTVHYGYDVKLKTYVTDDGTHYRSTDINDIFNFSQMEQESGSAGLMSSFGSLDSYSLWEEIVPGPSGEPVSDMIKDQYDLLYGRWPERPNEILLKIGKNNDISDLAFYTLGLMSRDELTTILGAVMSQHEIHVEEKTVSFDDILNVRFKMVLPTELYRDNDGDGVFEYIGNSDDLVSLIAKNCPDLTICGIIKKNPDINTTAMNQYTVFAYTHLLTDMIIERTSGTETAKAFNDSENNNFDIFTGLPFVPDFRSLSDDEKAETVSLMTSEYTDEQKAAKYEKLILTPDEEYISEAIKEITDITDREEAEKIVAETYGIDVSLIKQYLDPYSDEELFDMMKQAAERYVSETYEKNARKKIEEVISTPSDFELSVLSTLISSQYEERAARTAFIADYWDKIGMMSRDEAASYLSSLDDVSFESSFERTVRNAALETYKEASQGDTDSSNRKLAEAFDKLLSDADTKKKAYYYDILISDEISPYSYAEYKKQLGIAEPDSPSFIHIFPATFENKDRIAALIEGYNDSVSEEDRISYTDYVAILMSGVTIIINVISYVLIGFVGVSLVVSSIMIGIITYISVLERTKEIGILRSIGASKRDVSRVFTAETLIIGLISGLIGIGASALLCIPINIIVHALSGINTINASLPWTACVILVLISMALTLMAGLFPSRSASRKDPVEALRSE